MGQVVLAKSNNVSKDIQSFGNVLIEPKHSNLVALAKFFKVSIDYLAGFDNFLNRNPLSEIERENDLN